MRRSSAYKVQYELRPSKQTERRLLLDILRIASETGFAVRDSQYLGFGGVRFYDFEMMFRHLGMRNMTSVELDKTLFARCRYNKPFGFIDFKEGYLTDYLEETLFRRPVVAWLDYDCALSGSVIEDLRILSGRIPAGSFVFATIDARVPKGLASLKGAKRLAAVREEFKGFSLASNAAEVADVNFPRFAERVAWSALSESLSKRTDGIFVPIMRLFYDDTTLMITVGGCLAPTEVADNFRKRLREDLGFLLPRKNLPPFLLPSFNHTPRERQLLDISVSKNSKRPLTATLRKLGLTSDEVSNYKKVFRFVPRYTESYL